MGSPSPNESLVWCSKQPLRICGGSAFLGLTHVQQELKTELLVVIFAIAFLLTVSMPCYSSLSN